jgi:hypothetical protein
MPFLSTSGFCSTVGTQWPSRIVPGVVAQVLGQDLNRSESFCCGIHAKSAFRRRIANLKLYPIVKPRFPESPARSEDTRGGVAKARARTTIAP